ncbi:efflux RND transporter periplasmic adaptor subunit [uncultured Thiodictyon sp.]|uniref:efflux RND transporter periplasmic adaptor subunit n=1 Tax=uncultured Thiodictyon sp. TaxID=1846217 RepID=UPI0025D0ED67|nr:efflux RND transporter periplasmic adaptor subunit [uncultured Thiodictyon sp.]
MRLFVLMLAASMPMLTGCNDAPAPKSAGALPPFVRTVAVTGGAGQTLGLSGTVRARVESPLAFQVGGRIASRSVDAGQSVKTGQVLFELDRRDLEQSVASAEADLAGAEAGLATADAELARHRQMREKRFTSAQELERAELARREAQTRRDAATARAAQARNALGYGRLQAPTAGVLIDVTGEPGQVVAAGQAVATLAKAGEREVEVWFPEGVTPPAGGEAVPADGAVLPLRLRETAGAADPQGRTRRARYTVLDRQEVLVLGAVLRARFAGGEAGEGAGEGTAGADFAVPIAAIDERGQGPRVWRFQDGGVKPVPVAILSLDSESARIRGPLAAGERIVALGTHLLTEEMQVRELKP